MKLDEKTLKKLKDREMLFDELSDSYFTTELVDMTNNVYELIFSRACTFSQIVDRFKQTKDKFGLSYLPELLRLHTVFEKLIARELIVSNDLKYLFDNINHENELGQLVVNRTLLWHFLNEFLFADKEAVEKLNRLLNDDNWIAEWCNKNKSKNVFDIISYFEADRDEQFFENKTDTLQLIKINKYLSNNAFAANQKLDLIKILRVSKRAKEMLERIIDNNLQEQYKDFESLKNLLIKDDNKKLKIKFNF